MSEIKRINHLWSNESLHLKQYIKIPIYDDTVECDCTGLRPQKQTAGSESDTKNESVQDIFKRVDMTLKKTSQNVHKIVKNSR